MDATLTKYLRCLEPIQSQDEFDRTKHLVDVFRSPNETIGQRLQDMLIEHATQSENYVCKQKESNKTPNLFFISRQLIGG